MYDRPTIQRSDFSNDEAILGFELIDFQLPFEVLDPEDLLDTWSGRKIVPYSGSMTKSGDNLLNFYNSMASDGTTSNACIEAKKIVGFGNKCKIVKRTDSYFDIDGEADEVVSKELSKKYIEFVNNIDWGRDGNIMDCSINQYVEWEKNGNMWIEINLIEVGTERISKLIRRETAHCRYKFVDNKQTNTVLYSIKWDNTYLSKNEPREIPLYPAAIKEKGVIKTIIHVKNGNYWYGRPPSKGSILNQYNEYQNMYYLCRITGKEFTGKVIIEVEDDAPNNNRLINNRRDKAAGFGGTLDRFERKFTQSSNNPSTVILTTRPSGSRPMEVKQILPNTNEKYYKVMNEINAQQIITSHSWSPRLLGGGAGSLFTSQVYVDELKVKDATTNLFNQNKVHYIISSAIKECIMWQGEDKLMDVTHQYVSPYLKLIENEKNVNDIFRDPEMDSSTQVD